MVQVFKCLEPGCTEEIEYEPIWILGDVTGRAAGTLRAEGQESGTKIVYLECPVGHGYPYKVTKHPVPVPPVPVPLVAEPPVTEPEGSQS